MRQNPTRVFGRDYILIQSFSCYFASFIYLLGYNLSSKDVECTPLWGHVSLLISMGFLLMAIMFMVAAFFRNPPTWAHRTLTIMERPIWIASIGSVFVAFLQSIELVPHDSSLFKIVLGKVP